MQDYPVSVSQPVGSHPITSRSHFDKMFGCLKDLKKNTQSLVEIKNKQNSFYVVSFFRKTACFDEKDPHKAKNNHCFIFAPNSTLKLAQKSPFSGVLLFV